LTVSPRDTSQPVGCSRVRRKMKSVGCHCGRHPPMNVWPPTIAEQDSWSGKQLPPGIVHVGVTLV